MKFLIVDDSLLFRQFVTRCLLSRIPNHHTIFEAGDGGEAVVVYQQVRPDWVLMDIAMDPMDGLTASRAILHEYPEAKIIIVTNYNDAQYRKAANEAGTIAYVLKEQLSDLLIILSQQHSRGPL